VITVSGFQYWVLDYGLLPEIQDSMYKNFNGLVSAQGSFAIIMTGTQAGHIRLTIDVFDQKPQLHTTEWDDVVEVSLEFEESGGVYTDDGEGLDQLPDLPPGDYRLRVHARGRDRAHERAFVWDTSMEEHLLQAWPAPRATEIAYKLTDAYGASIRARE
jgi:hypothetical protein